MKIATMTTAECEAALGPRGNLQVTSANRREVRKWLNAQGFPALFSGGLSMRELALAYNDTTGKALQQLRRKLGEIEGATDEDGPRVDTGASQEGGETLANVIAGQPKAVAKKQQATEDSTDEELREAAENLAEILKRRGGANLDEDRVRVIAREEDQAFWEKAKDKLVQSGELGRVARIEIQLPDSDEVRVIEGAAHPEMEDLLIAAASRQIDGFHPNIWVAGPAGSGKTHGCKAVIKAMGLDCHFNGALSMAHELTGFRDAAGNFHPTAFYRAYGAKAGYIFDEVDGSDNSALLALNAALANGVAYFPDGPMERHKDSLIMATANTWGLGATADYVGRAKIDAAFMSRFPVRFFWDYDNDLEKRICGNADFAARVQKARAKARTAGIKVLIDPRASIAGAALIAAGMSPDKAAKRTYLANLTPEQRQIVEAA